MPENKIAAEKNQNENSIKGIYMMTLSAFIFTLMDTLVKWTGEDYPVIQLIFFRNVFGLIPVVIILWQTGNFQNLKTTQPFKHILRGCFGMAAMFFVFTSYTLLPMADVVTIIFAAPLLSSLFAIPILREMIGLHRAIAIVAGFIGVMIVVQPGSGMMSSNIIYPVMAAIFMACAMLIVRIIGKTEHGSVTSFYFTVFGAIVGSIGLFYEGWVMPQGIDWVLLIAIGILGGTAQYYLTSSFVAAEVALVSPFKYTALIWAVGIAYLVWGEVPAFETVLGAGVIILSSLYMLHREIYWAKKSKPVKQSGMSNLKSKILVFLQRS